MAKIGMSAVAKLLGLLGKGGPTAAKMAKGYSKWSRRTGTIDKLIQGSVLMGAPRIVSEFAGSATDLGGDLRKFASHAVGGDWQPQRVERATQAARAQGKFEALDRARTKGAILNEEALGEGLQHTQDLRDSHQEPLADQLSFVRNLHRQHEAELGQMAAQDQGQGGLAYILAKYAQ